MSTFRPITLNILSVYLKAMSPYWPFGFFGVRKCLPIHNLQKSTIGLHIRGTRFRRGFTRPHIGCGRLHQRSNGMESMNEVCAKAIETIYRKVSELVSEAEQTSGVDFTTIKDTFKRDCEPQSEVTIESVVRAARSAISALHKVSPRAISA